MRYAEKTSVSSEKSKAEIESTLKRYGAEQFAYAWKNEMSMIQFIFKGRHIRFLLPLPDKNAEEYTRTPGRHRLRDSQSAYEAWEQACRQRWRALAIIIKAKLEAVESGITTFEDEFLAHTVLPGGQTVSEWLQPQVEKAYLEKKMPQLLLEA